jgi:hypothetical protein
MPKKETVDMISEMRRMQSMLEQAASYGMTSEVIAFALDAMKNKPSLSLSEALACGCEDWYVPTN